MTQKPETLAAFKQRMGTIKVPEGFTATWEEEKYGFGVHERTVVKFTLTKADDTTIQFDHQGGGHTCFKTAADKNAGDCWRSFDRRGVEDSFYHWPLYEGQEIESLDTLVAEQLKRVADRKAYYASAIEIPDIPFTTAPDSVAGLRQQLEKSGSITFVPAGFGTGYCITKKPTQRLQYGEKKASPALEAFFGIKPLYVCPFDAD